jgi:hypothetical protein
MNQTEIVKMLTFMKPHEPYMVVDDVTVMSWAAVLNKNAPDLSAAWLYEFVADYYGTNEGGLTAAKVCEGWRRKKVADYGAIMKPLWELRDKGEMTTDECLAKARETKASLGHFPKPLAVEARSEW